MRGRHDPQATMLAFVDLEERVPTDHPLRTIKVVADEALERLSAEFDGMYSKVGRASVPPERLLKASLLICLYSVRSERAFCEELEYNLLFRWFLDMNLMERSFDVDDQDLYTIVITTYIPPRQVGDGPWTPWYADYYHR